MDRRTFSRSIAGLALGAAGLDLVVPRRPLQRVRGAAGVPFDLSVTPWTVFRKLPFEQRLEKVSEAGYKKVELIGEYKGWVGGTIFKRANAKRKELGITFDTTALGHAVGNPKQSAERF